MTRVFLQLFLFIKSNPNTTLQMALINKKCENKTYFIMSYPPPWGRITDIYNKTMGYAWPLVEGNPLGFTCEKKERGL